MMALPPPDEDEWEIDIEPEVIFLIGASIGYFVGFLLGVYVA